VVANVAQTGPHFSAEALTLRFNFLNPVSGFRQLFSVKSLYNMGLALVKILLIAFVLFLLLRRQVDTILSLSSVSVESFAVWLFHLLFTLAITVTVLFIAVAALDYVYQHHTYEKAMLMTKKEVEDEHKNQELPAVVKGAQRRKMRELTLLRMMAAVPNASVVITNPTHVAVALEYSPDKMAAPRVVAKGLRLVAERIKAIAAENGVPIIEKPEIARDLYKHVKVGQFMPGRLFGAVAEILAYLYRIGNDRIRNAVQTAAPVRNAQPRSP
jgi:flagellar biosynthetic protein FlhB